MQKHCALWYTTGIISLNLFKKDLKFFKKEKKLRFFWKTSVRWKFSGGFGLEKTKLGAIFILRKGVFDLFQTTHLPL